jgi:hypothetical protein
VPVREECRVDPVPEITEIADTIVRDRIENVDGVRASISTAPRSTRCASSSILRAWRRAASRSPTSTTRTHVGTRERRAGDLGDTSRAPVGAVGAEATVPLWAGGGRAAATRGAKAVEDSETLGVLIAERALEAELRVALRRARDVGAGLGVAEATMELAREELDRATVRYREGVGDHLSVVTAQGQVAQAQQFRVNALGAYNLSVIDWFEARARIAELAAQSSLRSSASPFGRPLRSVPRPRRLAACGRFSRFGPSGPRTRASGTPLPPRR